MIAKDGYVRYWEITQIEWVVKWQASNLSFPSLFQAWLIKLLHNEAMGAPHLTPNLSKFICKEHFIYSQNVYCLISFLLDQGVHLKPCLMEGWTLLMFYSVGQWMLGSESHGPHPETFPHCCVALNSSNPAQTNRELCKRSGAMFSSFVCVICFLANK